MKFFCPHCAQPLEVNASYAGSEYTCPACTQPFVIPKPTVQVTKVSSDSPQRIGGYDKSTASEVVGSYGWTGDGTGANNNGKFIVFAVTGCLVALCVFIWIDAPSADREQTSRDAAATQAVIEHAAQEERSKQPMRQAIIESCPELLKYIDDTKAGIDKTASACYSVDSVVKSHSSMLNNEIASKLSDAVEALEKAGPLLRSKAPDYVKADNTKTVSELDTAAETLNDSIRSFLNLSSESDGNILAQRMASALSAVNGKRGELAMFGTDVLNMVNPEIIEKAKTVKAKQEYLLQHPDEARKIEQEKQDELARQTALAKKAEDVTTPVAGKHGDSMTFLEWQAFVRKDAKISTLISKLGKPDEVRSYSGIKANVWYHALGDNTEEPNILAVLIGEYHGETIVVGLRDVSGDQVQMMPWADQVLNGLN